MIRNATIHDVPRISDIINSHAELGKMLFKSYAQLFESLRDFAVYEEDGRILGCVALSIIWADLTEVRSLASLYNFVKPGELLAGLPEHPAYRVFWNASRSDSFAPPSNVLELQHTKLR